MRQFHVRCGGPSGVAATTGPNAGSGMRPGVARSGRRRGIASVLAMIYMIIFSALALGFYATVSVAAQVAHNERRTASAQASAESAFLFTRYQLSRLDFPVGIIGDELSTEVYLQLSKHLDKTANLRSTSVGFDGKSIAIPSTGHVKLDTSGTQKFRADLSFDGDQLVARFTGRAGDGGAAKAECARAVEVRFAKTPHQPSIFNFGVASRGSITTSGASTIKGLTDPARGGILSTSSSPTAVTINGKAVSGDIGMTNPKASVSLGSGVSVGGTYNTALIYKNHVKTGVPEPRFPDVDTAVYSKFATNVYAAGMTNLDNVRVPAGVTASVSGGTVRGVLYLEKGAAVKFSGSTVVQGVIVGSADSV